MKESKYKTKEVLLILHYLFFDTDKKTLKYLDYVRLIKNDFNIDIDCRRVMQIIEGLKGISDEDIDNSLLKFDMKESQKSKGKYYRDNFLFDEQDIKNMIDSLKNYPYLSKEKQIIYAKK